MGATKIWHLYHSATKEQIKDLTHELAIAHVKKLTEAQRSEWFAWSAGYTDWVPLDQVEDLRVPHDRRRYPRVQLRVNVTIIVGFQKFQTFTKDISTGGALLDRALPFKPFNESCRVILTYPDLINESLEFKARVFLSDKNPKRLEFLNGEARFKKRLATWIDRALARKKEVA